MKFTAMVINKFTRKLEEVHGTVETTDEEQAIKTIKYHYPLVDPNSIKLEVSNV